MYDLHVHNDTCKINIHVDVHVMSVLGGGGSHCVCRKCTSAVVDVNLNVVIGIHGGEKVND